MYGKWIQDQKIELIVPIPLHWRRKRKRGFNQAEVIAKHLGELTGLPVDTKSVIRKKYTKPQKLFNNKERIKNVKNVFEAGKRMPQKKKILLIDDIYTTGSTIDAVSKIFLEKGDNNIWFLTISIGQDF